MSAELERCWLCSSPDLRVAKKGDLEGDLDSRSFMVTDAHYGQTAEIQRCGDCDFLQCTHLAEVLTYYEGMEDSEYEEGREERGLQMKKILSSLPRPSPGASLLDVGAGSGILVEQAIVLGYRADGIEPSQWFHDLASRRGLPVELGTLPNTNLQPPYDVVTLVDVIEHVSNPIELLELARDMLSSDGTLLVVTPDVGSLAARLLGWRWWHFRVAHIGYFDRKTLGMALARAGLEVRKLRRPTWYFSASYLMQRVNRYLPGWLQLPNPAFLRSMVVPLNLGDSILVLAERAGRT